MITPKELTQELGGMDIYLLDQVLKGTFSRTRTVLDVGCGRGRNLVYFLQNGFEVSAIDSDPVAVESVANMMRHFHVSQDSGRTKSPLSRADAVRVAQADDIPFPDAGFDLVICNAVLHFARDPRHFSRMAESLWAALSQGGFLFVRTASSIGLDVEGDALGDGRFLLPDGSERYLVDEELLLTTTRRWGGTLAEPIKTSIVQNLRSMTTWCVRK